MDLIRKHFDNFYDRIKQPIFRLTERDPEIAHNVFTLFCQFLYYSGLDKLLGTTQNNFPPGPPISNAAGFNKNCEIPPRTMKYFGDDRIVIGSVNGEFWKGKKRPRMIRDIQNESLINWMGLNSDGAEVVAKRIENYYEKGLNIPLTISVTPTPDISWSRERRLEDVAKTINAFRDFSFVDRLEYNPSCPNTEISGEEQLEELEDMLELFIELAPNKKLYVKVSPDMNQKEIVEFIDITFSSVKGYVLANSTKQHLYGKGGGSGELAWKPSLETQKEFHKELKNTPKKIIACGGINSKERVNIREDYGASEIQIFTPRIFRGTKLLRELRG